MSRLLDHARILDARIKAWRPPLPQIRLVVSPERAVRDLALAAAVCFALTPFLAHAWLTHSQDQSDNLMAWASASLGGVALCAGLAERDRKQSNCNPSVSARSLDASLDAPRAPPHSPRE
jgi:hypothetical protein